MSDFSGKSEETSMLGNSLFSNALINGARSKIANARYDLSRGALEQAGESYKRANRELFAAFLTMPLPGLSDAENKEYLKLLNERFTVNEKGKVDWHQLDDEKWDRLQELDRKGTGKTQSKDNQ